MKFIYPILFIQCLFISSFISAQNGSGKLILLHSNDLHSNMTGFSPESEYTPCNINDDFTSGGFARIASIIEDEKLKNGNNLLVVDAGDFLMGTFFHTLEAETGFQLNLMKKMGYDVLTLGNHEFDYGPETLYKIINSSLSNGDIPDLSFANVEFSSKSDKDDGFEQLYRNNTIKSYHVYERAGLKIGLFGILGKNATDVAPNIKPLKVNNRIKTAKKIVKVLKEEEKVDLIICLSHSGINKDKKGNWTGEDVELAEKVKGINVIVGGHTHTELLEPVVINDIPILQTGSQGKNLGRFEMNIHNGNIVSAKYQLIRVDDRISGNCNIDEMINGQILRIDDKLLNPMGLSYHKPLAETGYELVCDENGDLGASNLGPLLADAIYYYVNEFSPVKTDVSIIATGVIRDKIRTGNNGIQTVPDIFRIVSLGEGEDGIPGYPLAMVYLTGKEIKKVLELLLIAPKIDPVFYCYYGGINIYYDSTKGIMNKIKRIEIGGNDIDLSGKNSTLYGITADSYMLEFVSTIKKMSYGLINIKPKNIRGEVITDFKTSWIDFNSSKDGIQEGKEWVAVVKFLETFEDIDGNGIPDFPEKYSNPIHRTIDISEK